MSHPSPLSRLGRAATVAVAAALLASAVPADKVREDVGRNFVLVVPESWTWSEPGAEGEKLGIAARGFRRLTELRRGGTPNGEGAEVVLALTPAPEGKSVDDLAADPEVRRFLLARFAEDASAWPEVKVSQGELEPEDAEKGGPVPTRILVAEGEARNLDGNRSKARGVLLLSVVRGQLLRLRMYAWHTPYDDEQLKADIDYIEVEFGVLTTKEERKPEAGKPPPEEPDEAPVQGDAGEEKVVENVAQRWRLKKPKGITSVEYDLQETPMRSAYFEASESGGSYQIVLDVYTNGATNAQGQRMADQDIKNWVGSNWWGNFSANHPEGEVLAFEWPKKTPNRTFVTLPDLKEPIVAVKEGAKRPIDPKTSDMEKMKAVEKVAKPRLAGRTEPTEGYRGALMGNRPRVGRELVLRFAWKTQTHTYMLMVSCTKDVLQKYEGKIRELLESVEIFEK